MLVVVPRILLLLLRLQLWLRIRLQLIYGLIDYAVSGHSYSTMLLYCSMQASLVAWSLAQASQWRRFSAFTKARVCGRGLDMLVMAGPGFRCRAMCLSFGWGHVFELRVGFVRQGFRMGVRPRHERIRETVWLERFLMAVCAQEGQ